MPSKDDLAICVVISLFLILFLFVLIMSDKYPMDTGNGGLEIISVDGGVTCYRDRSILNWNRPSISCVKN